MYPECMYTGGVAHVVHAVPKFFIIGRGDLDRQDEETDAPLSSELASLYRMPMLDDAAVCLWFVWQDSICS